MDIARPNTARPIARRTVVIAVAAIVIAISVAVAQLSPASVPVKRSSVMTDTVRRGTLVRSVRGSGRLVPEQSRWIAAVTDGRVDTILVQPGTAVTASTIVIELSDPQQQQQLSDAQWQLKAAEADYESLQASLQMEALNQQAANAQLRAEFENARLRAESDALMAKQGIVADLTRRVSTSNADELGRRVALDDHRLRVAVASLQSRLSAQRAAVEQRRALYLLRKNQVEALRVPAGINGVLQEVAVEVGQRVASGATLARVVQPEQLKAEIRIAEAQARHVQTGLTATVDTYNGKVSGVVSRMDPAAREGSVTVDVRLTAPLPPGARPDLNVEAVIELGRLADTLSVARPAGADDGAAGIVFRVTQDGNAAERVSVTFGQSSAEAIQITDGLKAGDTIIVSDSSAWNKHPKIEFK